MSVLKRYNNGKWETIIPSPNIQQAEEINNYSNVFGASVKSALNTLNDRTNSLESEITALNSGSVTVSDEIITEKVNDWLAANPSATTTVEDHSLTLNKFALGELGYVTPEQFGAVGDGMTDDTEAIQNAINTHLPVVFKEGATYIVISFTLYNGCKLYGNGATLMRPNLKEAPYNYTENQINSLRMFQITRAALGLNEFDLQVEFRDLTIDLNAFTMWSPSDPKPYRLEQGVCIFCNTNSEYHHVKLLVNNCTFKNNYASNIAVQNYCDITITNCKSINCFKGICTVVGDGNNIYIDNCLCKSDYDFTAFWYEPNDYVLLKNSVVNITNCTFLGQLQGITSRYGTFNIANTYIESTYIYFVSKIYTNCTIESTKMVIIGENPIKVRGYGYVSMNNCTITSKYDENSSSYLGLGISLKQSTSKDFYTTLNINNCIFENLKRGVTIDSSSGKFKIFINNSIFKNITEAAFGPTPPNQGASFEYFCISNCTFDITGYLYYHNGGSEQTCSPIFNGGNDIINPSNLGLYFTKFHKPIFKNEIWSVPVPVTVYGTGNIGKIIGLGKRTTYIETPPTFTALNDIDYAKLTVSPYTEYRYSGNAWNEIT